jgi:hypothetical protein
MRRTFEFSKPTSNPIAQAETTHYGGADDLGEPTEYRAKRVADQPTFPG